MFPGNFGGVQTPKASPNYCLAAFPRNPNGCVLVACVKRVCTGVISLAIEYVTLIAVRPTDRLLVFVELEAAPYAGDNHIAITCGTNSAVMYLGPRVTSLTSGKDKNRDRRVCSSALNG